MTSLIHSDRASSRSLRSFTGARVDLGRCGAGLPTVAMLSFQAAHARARDAVQEPLAMDSVPTLLDGHATIHVTSRAANRADYLRNPGLGRRLNPQDAGKLGQGDFDVVFVVGDGLSATAVHRHAPAVLAEITTQPRGWKVAPIVIASQARVALGDEIGELLGARMAVVLIGERPGLSASDSLGIYLTWRPRVGCLDSERNCISNIRPGGQPYAEAASRLLWLMGHAWRLGQTGVALKDDYDSEILPG